MSHNFTVTDEQYAIIARHAMSKGMHPDDSMSAWIEDLNQTPTYYETDDWFRHLGVSEERIAAINTLIAREESAGEPCAEPEDAHDGEAHANS
jgi:hypothetical protein